MRKNLTLIACAVLMTGFWYIRAAESGSAPNGGHGQTRNDSPQKGVAATLPYFNDFNDESKFEGWTCVNTNTAFTWQWYSSGGKDYTGCLYMTQMPDAGQDTPSDNWVFSPAFDLQEGFTYQLKFYVTNWFPADLEVRLTEGADIGAPGTLLYNYKGEDWGEKEVQFEVPSTGSWHIAFYDKSPYTQNNTHLRYHIYIDDLLLQIMSNNAVPEAPGELRQIPGVNGEISMGLTWTNPTLSKKGEELDLLSDVRIFRDGELVETIRENVTPGGKMSWTDPATTAGRHVYKVVVSNTTGEGDPAEVNTFVGIDYPGTPENVMVDYDPDGGIITLDWEEPSFGRRGGWFDKTGLSYRVVRQPGGRLLADRLTEPYFEDADLTDYGNYIYEVTARTDAGLGGTAVTEGVMVGSNARLPIIEGWENKRTYPVWEIVDNNSDGHTLYIRHAFGHESNSTIGWDYTQTEVDIDESLYSAPVRLEKGKKYRASFWVMSHASGLFSCDFSYGKAKTRAAQTNTLVSYADMTTNGEYAPVEVSEFTVGETGTYYFSLWVHDCSQHRLWFDDFRIEEVTDKNVEATSVRNLNDAPTVGDRITTGVTYTNRGTARSGSFKIQLIDDDENVLGEQTVSRPVNSGNSGTANIEWTVPNAVGRFAIRGRVIMDGDRCEADNVSAPRYLDIQEPGIRAMTVGNSSDLSMAQPFSCEYFNFSEYIYHAEDLGNIAGNINSMSFKVQFGMDSDYPKTPFKVYIGSTTENDLYKGWIPADYSMTKVFDGTLDLMRGMTDVRIPFDKPYSYEGGNIVVIVEGAHDANLMLSQGYGMFNYVTECGLGVSRVWDDRVNRPDPAAPDQTVGRYYSYRPDVTFFIDHSVSARITGTITDTDGNPVEGVTVNGGTYNPWLQGVTDAEGKYEIPYFPVGWGSISIEANKKGWQTGYIYGQAEPGETVVMDFDQMRKCEEITVKGKVCSAIDYTTPVAGAKVTAIGDNELTAETDAEGNFTITGAYANKAYTAFTIEADGYQPLSQPGTRFEDWYGTGECEMSYLNLSPVTAAPFSVKALDRGEKAEISWEDPVEDVTVSKATQNIAGMFGGENIISIAHRYSADELAALGVGSDLLLKAVRLMPMCHSRISLTVWQGPEGNEVPVYMEDVTTDKYKQWNTFQLSEPYRIDTTKSLLIGFKMMCNSGSYPVGFDSGPLAEGGDVILDPVMNEWTTAHDILPESMQYNWAIQAVFGNDPNSAPVPWVGKPAGIPEKRVVNVNNAMLEEPAVPNVSASESGERKSGPDQYGMELLETPIYAPATCKSLKHDIKGYNIFRIEPGEEDGWIEMWTKVNEEPVSGNSFTDESWGAAENKPYRYAVVSYYGNPYEWGLGVNSDPTFSDGVDKGRYSTVTVNVNAGNGKAEGTNVYFSGDGKSLIKTVEEGESSVSFEDIRFADYKVKAVKPYYDLYTADLKVENAETGHDAALTFSAPAVTDLQAVDYISEARLAWTEPTAAVGLDINSGNYNPGMALSGFRLGNELAVGYRVTPEARTGYDYTDFYIDEISFYANAATTYWPVVWRRNLRPDLPRWDREDLEEEHEIYRQRYDVTPEEVGTWVKVRLDEPVKINSKDTYYIGFAATTTNEHTPFVLDDSEGADDEAMWRYDFDQEKGRYLWMRSSMGAGWMVKAHINDKPVGTVTEKEPVHCDVYRMLASDKENEQKWVRVNSSPLDTDSYADASWKEQPDADYHYAVKALYEGGATSAAAFSKKLPKGKVSLVKMNLSTDNSLSAAGAKVSLSFSDLTYRAEAGTDGKVEIPEVMKNRDYNVRVVLPGYEEIDEKTKIDKEEVSLSYELSEIKEAPAYVDAVASADNSKVDLTWREPGSYAPAEGWVHWDNGKPYAGFGTSTGFCAVAQAFLPEDLETMRMKEYDITKISFFPTSSSDNPVSSSAYWVAKIWRIDMVSGTVEEVATGTGSDITLDRWNEIEFDTPYHVNGDESLLIGYEFHGSGNALGIDQGPCQTGRGDWANFGQGWLTLSSSVSGFDYNNLIHVYMENLGKRDREKAPAIGDPQPVLKDAAAEIKVSKVSARNAVTPEHPQLVSGTKYFHKGYLVYRFNTKDMDNESAWTLLTPDPISATEFSDINWKNVSDGAYRWAVKAVYATGNSAPEFSMIALNEDGTLNSVDGIETGDVRVARIPGDRLLVDVPSDATVNIVDASGLNILAANLPAGENILDIDMNDGVYMIRVAMDGETRTFKLMIK